MISVDVLGYSSFIQKFCICLSNNESKKREIKNAVMFMVNVIVLSDNSLFRKFQISWKFDRWSYKFVWQVTENESWDEKLMTMPKCWLKYFWESFDIELMLDWIAGMAYLFYFNGTFKWKWQ